MESKVTNIKLTRLEFALREFDSATTGLEKAYCGDDCKTKEKCEKSTICRTAIEKANLECIRYHYILDEIEKEYGGVPKEQAEKYISDVNRCLGIINRMNNGDSGIWGFAQQMAIRRDLVERKFKLY